MSETDLTTHYLELMAMNYQNIYWFLSVTFALYSAAYFIGKKVVLGTMVFISTGYILFLVFLTGEMLAILRFYRSITEDLIDLERNGAQLSNLSQDMINLTSLEDISVWNMIGALFLPIAALGGIGYFIFQYQRGRKERTAKIGENDT